MRREYLPILLLELRGTADRKSLYRWRMNYFGILFVSVHFRRKLKILGIYLSKSTYLTKSSYIEFEFLSFSGDFKVGDLITPT